MNFKPKKVNLTSSNLTEEKLGELYRILPEVFTEGGIDFDKLRAVLGDNIQVGPEKFSFSWAGKSNAIKNVLVPSHLTLNPEPNQSIKWDDSENLFIEGDNLEVLKLLQRAYFEKVKMIYIDPPYNTGHDFVYKDDFSSPLDNYLKQTGQKTETGESTTTNKETNGRYHSDWLSMMYPRLKLAWNLLREDGVIFVSIDDNEVHHLRMIMDEVFGSECFVGQFPWRKRTTKSDVPFGVSQDYEWIVGYGKNLNFLAGISHERKYYSSEDYPNDKWRLSDLTTQKIESDRPNSAFDLVDPKTKKVYPYNPKRLWGITKDTFQDYYNKGKIVFPDDYDFLNITIPAYRVFESEDKQKALKKYGSEDAMKAVSTFLPKEVGMNEDGNKEMIELFNEKVFSYPKPVSLVKHFIEIINDPEALILDFFGGSGTAAHAVLEQNQEDEGTRKFILVQLPEKLEEKSEGFNAGYKTISDIAKERIRRVINGYGENPQPINTGFKVFTLSESNYPENNFVLDVEKSQEENQKAFIGYLDKAKQGQLFNKGNDTSLVYENIIKEGLSLNSKVEKVFIGKNNVYKVTDGEQQLLICLESKLAPETIRELTDKANKERIFICIESSLDDTTAANLSLNLDLKAI